MEKEMEKEKNMIKMEIQNMKVNISMEEEMEMEKNMIKREIQNMKVNISMEKEMEKEKNILMVNYILMVNLKMGKFGQGKDMIQKIIYHLNQKMEME